MNYVVHKSHNIFLNTILQIKYIRSGYILTLKIAGTITFDSKQLKLIFKGKVLEGKKEQDFVCIPETCILGLSGKHVDISFKL